MSWGPAFGYLFFIFALLQLGVLSMVYEKGRKNSNERSPHISFYTRLQGCYV